MRKIIMALFLTGAGLLFSFGAAAQESTTETDHWHGWHDHSHGFWWVFPLIFMFILFSFLFRGRGRRYRSWWWPGFPNDWRTFSGDEGAQLESVLDLLDRRYAQGEIDKEEYEEKRATITSANT